MDPIEHQTPQFTEHEASIDMEVPNTEIMGPEAAMGMKVPNKAIMDPEAAMGMRVPNKALMDQEAAMGMKVPNKASSSSEEAPPHTSSTSAIDLPPPPHTAFTSTIELPIQKEQQKTVPQIVEEHDRGLPSKKKKPKDKRKKHSKDKKKEQPKDKKKPKPKDKKKKIPKENKSKKEFAKDRKKKPKTDRKKKAPKDEKPLCSKIGVLKTCSFIVGIVHLLLAGWLVLDSLVINPQNSTDQCLTVDKYSYPGGWKGSPLALIMWISMGTLYLFASVFISPAVYRRLSTICYVNTVLCILGTIAYCGIMVMNFKSMESLLQKVLPMIYLMATAICNGLMSREYRLFAIFLSDLENKED